MKGLHQSTFFTGDVPLELFGSDFGGRDDENFDHARLAWSGCIDAPGNMPGGSTVQVVIDEWGEAYPIGRSIPRNN